MAVGEHGHVIDHLAIGPSGVFAITVIRGTGGEVVARGDRLVVDGVERAFLNDSRDASSEASVQLTHTAGFNVPARGLLVFCTPRSVTASDEPYDVGVTGDRALRTRLARAPRVLEAAQIAATADAAAEIIARRAARRAAA